MLVRYEHSSDEPDERLPSEIFAFPSIALEIASILRENQTYHKRRVILISSGPMNTPRRSRNRAACRRCQRRKIRCNGETPSCGACIKANVPCVTDGKQEVNRT